MTAKNNQPIEGCCSLSDEKLDKVSGGKKWEPMFVIKRCTGILKCKCGFMVSVSSMDFYPKRNRGEYVGYWRCSSCNKINSASGKLSILDNGDVGVVIS